MKAMCKRTYFVPDIKEPIFKKNKYYEVLDKGDFFLEIKQKNGESVLFNKKNFDKFFVDIDELRDNKINEILNR